MSSKVDARIIKTKAKLLEALTLLLRERLFEDITVNDLCTRADVRRATFYKHFDDKYAFLKYYVGSLRNKFDKKIPQQKMPNETLEYYTEYLRGIVGFLDDNEVTVKNLMDSNVLPELMEVIEEKNYEDTCVRLRKSVACGMKLPASVEITASMMTGAVSRTILSWLKSGKQMPKEELISEISNVIKNIRY
jgi:AcrR family transcriptional regulator